MNSNESKRILIFSTAYFPHVGGAEIAVKEITDRLPKGDYVFDMITLRLSSEDSKSAKIGNINIWRIGTGIRFLLPLEKLFFPKLAFLKALVLHKKNRYDKIWSIMASYSGFAALFFKITHPKIPFILTLQEGDSFEHIKKRVGVLWPVFKMIFKKADTVQAISNYLANWAKEMGAKGKIEVVPNGVDVDRFKIKPARTTDVVPRQNDSVGLESGGDLRLGDENTEKLREKLGIKEDDTVLITTSRLVPKNGIGDIIEALTYLSANVKFLILGSGQLERELKFKVLELGLENRVSFLGFVSHEEMHRYLYISQIFVRPSLSEGFGNSFIEAMAAGVPVIAAPVGGVVDFLKDGETGLFCEPKNPKNIAQKVEKLVKDKESREYIIKNALKMVAEKYDWEIIAEQMNSKVFATELDKQNDGK
ncbi:MAG: glycosyltransferase family 4 protein [Candidatus Paceibacterota bacterium]